VTSFALPGGFAGQAERWAQVSDDGVLTFRDMPVLRTGGAPGRTQRARRDHDHEGKLSYAHDFLS
jgi:hypothetical protein